MSKAATAAVLGRLTHGKHALSRAEMRDMLDEIARTPRETLLEAVFPQAPMASKPDTPDWLAAMQAAQRKLAWRADEATDQLYRLAVEVGYQLSGPRKRSFVGAARAIAEQLGADTARDLFVSWIENQISTRRLV